MSLSAVEHADRFFSLVVAFPHLLTQFCILPSSLSPSHPTVFMFSPQLSTPSLFPRPQLKNGCATEVTGGEYFFKEQGCCYKHVASLLRQQWAPWWCTTPQQLSQRQLVGLSSQFSESLTCFTWWWIPHANWIQLQWKSRYRGKSSREHRLPFTVCARNTRSADFEQKCTYCRQIRLNRLLTKQRVQTSGVIQKMHRNRRNRRRPQGWRHMGDMTNWQQQEETAGLTTWN